MSGWTETELAQIGATEELRIASRRRDGSLRRDVIIWVVRSGNDLYVRSAYGAANPWYRGAVSSGLGRITAGTLERDVVFGTVVGADASDAGGDVHKAIDAAYHAKYDRHGAAVVGTVVGPDAAPNTIRLAPATD
jgi:hypothetical protein